MIGDSTRLFEAAQKGEHLARGQAINRSEIMVEIIGTFVQEFAPIFLGVNNIANAEERKREYVRRYGEMLHNVYPVVKAGNIKLIKGYLSR